MLVSALVSCSDVPAPGDESSVAESAPESVGGDNSSAADSSESDSSDNEQSADVSDGESSEDASESENESVADDTSSTTPYQPNDGEFDLSNGLLILGDRCMESFAGSYDYANLYAQYIKAHKADLGSDVNVYSMVVPTASSIYLQDVVIDGEDFYKKYGGDQVKKLEYLDELFAKDGGVVSVNVYDELFAHWNEQIYFRTDWHWTQLGAYYAAQAFADTIGADMPTLDSGYYTKKGKYNEDGSPKDFLGTLYITAQKPAVLKNSPDEFFWYEFNHEYTVEYYDRETGKNLKRNYGSCYLGISDKYVSSWYMTFLDADNNLCKINTGTKNGKTAVVFKDSFGNCFAPMLMSMYETVYVVDFRHFKGNSVDFCKSVGATDVMFAISSFSAMGGNCSTIGKMRLR